jgi:hypothetical protein
MSRVQPYVFSLSDFKKHAAQVAQFSKIAGQVFRPMATTCRESPP